MTYLVELAQAMGYQAAAKEYGGYHVDRVILGKPCAGNIVFNPLQDSGQALEVMAYLSSQSDTAMPGSVEGIRAAIVAAGIGYVGKSA